MPRATVKKEYDLNTCASCIKKENQTIFSNQPLKETLLIGQIRNETESIQLKIDQWGRRKKDIALVSTVKMLQKHIRNPECRNTFPV
jgi:hypothetical protein